MARALANSENRVLNMEYLVQTIDLSLDFNQQFQKERDKRTWMKKKKEDEEEGGEKTKKGKKKEESEEEDASVTDEDEDDKASD